MKWFVKYSAVTFIFICVLCTEVSSQITIDTSFEGANARILSINNGTNTVKIESKLRAGDVHNVVFYCRVSGFNVSQPLKIQVKISLQYYMPVYAAYSYDRVNWTRITGVISGDSKEFSRIYQQNEIYFSYAYPYTYTDLLNLANRYSANQFVNVSNVAVSSGGRNVKLFRFTEPCVNDSSKVSIWILGRNHAMETHSNYVIEGLCDFLASGDFRADMLRRQAIIYVVPAMDVDMTFNGGTGKDQLPIDFNRDWDSPSYWPAVTAVKQKILETNSANRVKIFIDSHNPFPGQNDFNTWFYSRHSTGIRSENLDVFRSLLKDNGGYVFNREPLYATDGQTSASWVDSVLTTIDFATSLETSWIGRTDNVLWTIPLYKDHGAVLGKGISDYIGNIVKSSDIILDNTDTLNGVTITGLWSSSTFVPGYWGANYIHDGNTQQGTKKIVYTPVIPKKGFYEIFIRYTSDPGRATNVPVRIIHSQGIKDTLINQQVRGSRCLSLGMYMLDEGNVSSLTINTTNANGFVIADAVKFSPRDNCNPIGIINNSFPSVFELSVYPNPFNPEARFKFQLSKNSAVNISVYDAAGRLVRVIVNKNLNQGRYEYALNSNGLSSGVYYYCAEIFQEGLISSIIKSGKLVLVK